MNAINSLKEVRNHSELGINLEKEKDKQFQKLNNKYDKILNKKIKRKNSKIKYTKNDFNFNDNINFLKNITNDSYADYSLNNSFTVFKSIEEIEFLIYSNKKKSIISIKLIDNKIINEIKNAHKSYITNLRHYFDKNKNMDLILSVSGDVNNIKIWNFHNLECLINIEKIYEEGNIFSACLLNEKNINYIIASNFNLHGKSEFIKVFDFNKNKIKELKDSNYKTYFIDSFFDNNNINYIITGNKSFVTSYNFIEDKIYHKYQDYNNKDSHSHIIINNINEVLELIESSFDGNIRIWNFHSGELIKRIKVSQDWLFSICLFNNDYLIVGCGDKNIKLIDIKKEKVIKNLKGHNNHIICIKKINLRNNENYILSQGLINDQIKLWIINEPLFN